MAGSIKTFEYTTDDGVTYAINMDESNGEAVGNADFDATSTATMFLPRNCNPRLAYYSSADGKIRRQIPVTSNTATAGTLAATINAPDGIGGTATLSLTLFKGEQMTVIPKAADSGLDDGDAT